MKKKGLLIIIFLLAVFITAGFLCYKNYIADKYDVRTATVQDFCLDTIVSVTVYGRGDEDFEDVAARCISLCSEYELVFSPTDEDSELYKINETSKNYNAYNALTDDLPESRTDISSQDRSEPITISVSKDIYECMSLCRRYYYLSDGRYDITIRPVSELWDFHDNTEGIIPDSEAISEALALVRGADAYELSENADGYILTIYEPGIYFDLGSVAKGYIADRLKDYLTENSVYSAVIDLGGNIVTIGSKPVQGSGTYTAFNIGINMPFSGSGSYACIKEISDSCVVTSGVDQRYFISGDRLYHHILDAQTGYPAVSELYSVSVIGTNAAEADVLSTVGFLLGEERARALFEQAGVEGVFVTSEMEVR